MWRNIGIFAHVDAGKTTLSEQLLVHAGVVRRAGSVDQGTAHTDDLPVEQRRGISVRAACVSLPWKGVTIQLIDTPGHVDFSAEIERSFWAIDAAVLVVDAAQGVQPQTETLFRALKEQGLPFLIFLNKMDRPEADAEAALESVRRRLTRDIVPLWDAEALAECVCERDEALLDRYLDGETLPRDVLEARLAAWAVAGTVYPVLRGSALRDRGIEDLLDAMVRFLPPPDTGHTALCGVAFAAASDRVMGKGHWIRLYGGTLENRMAVDIPAGRDRMTGEPVLVQRKISRIRDIAGRDIDALQAGMVGVVYGLGGLRIGQVLGDPALLPRKVQPGRLKTPLITVQVIPERPDDLPQVRAACETLSEEDPLLHARYSAMTGELQLHVMGKVQLEILQEMLVTRFGLRVTFGDPTVIYRETIRRPAGGFVAYTMPKPCWAVLEFQLEPAPRGSGVSFSSVVPVRDIMAGYQRQVEQALPLALGQGRLGWPVTDVKITLIGGNHHLIHTHPLDFIVATPMGIQDGLRNAGSVLLEPILEVRFVLPAGQVGRVMSDVRQMRGEVLESAAGEDTAALTALIPVATSMDYPTAFASLTGGKGSMSASLHGYRECPLELGRTAPRRGVDPLDTARYILAARSALEGDIFTAAWMDEG